MAVRFSKQMIPNLIQPFWAAWQGGEFLTDAAALAGTYRHAGLAWLREAVGSGPAGALISKAATSPSLSEKSSPWVAPPVSRSAPSPCG